jgi:large subunit ribosomal protein L15
MRLNELSDRSGATKPRKRLGRGVGSGLGKTSGRGVKGQKARSGVAIKGFEGGQMPLHRRLPKRGFNNIFAKKYNELNLGRIQEALDAGRLDGKKPITADALREAGLIRRAKDGVRLLGSGELKAKVSFEVAGASQSAIKAVEAQGGTVTIQSITGREAPAADKIKADKRSAKRAALAAAPKGGKKKAKQAQDADEGAPAEAKAEAGAAEATGEPKSEGGEAKKKPAKKDKSE